ncbi:MAG: hypothetical protein NTY35_16780 [Planctomycetota bacterium]|nr:hypothetical protein [Planctomycetota bacterium]
MSSALTSEAISVAQGLCPPAHSPEDFLDEASRWVSRHVRPNETHTDAFVRLCADRDPALNVFYKAASIARAWAGDPSELLSRDPMETRARAWRDLLRLAEREQRADEDLRAALTRLLTENTAAAAAYLLILQGERQ